MEKQYKCVGGLYFTIKTPAEVCLALLKAYSSGKRVRLFYGNTETGRSTLDEYDIVGYVKSSTGERRIPILVFNTTCAGGTAISDNHIIRIQYIHGEVLYSHPNFHVPKLTVEGASVFCEGKIWANCDDERKAQRLYNFLTGKSMSK